MGESAARLANPRFVTGCECPRVIDSDDDMCGFDPTDHGSGACEAPPP